VTGHRASNEDLRLDWRGLASAETTLIVYMGASTIGDIAGHLIEQGLPESTPVLAVIAATTRREERLQATIGSVTSVFPGAIPEEPVLFIIGHVAALDQTAAASGVLDRLRERHEFSLA
jgi:uroporphyrin-III C-methyltransferase